MHSNIVPFRSRSDPTRRQSAWAVRDDYRLHLIGQGKTQQTVRTYISHLTCWTRWCEEQHISPLSAKRESIVRHVAEMIEQHSRSYANTRICFLRSFSRWAMGLGERRDDPTVGLKMRKEKIAAREPLTKSEQRRLLRAAETPLERAVVYLFLGSAIRRSELLAIRVEDIDWRRGQILSKGKGEQQRRVAPGQAAMKVLKRYLGDQETGAAFSIGKSTLKRILDTLAKRAKIATAVFPHLLRVTAICELLDAGADAISVSVVAGHSLRMVQYYQRAVERRRALSQQRRLSPLDRLAGGIFRKLADRIGA